MPIEISRRALVARELERAGERGLSGEALARELGVSRVTVAHDVAALRGLGYVIDAAPRTGYRMRRVPDLCLAEQVSPLLADRLWVRCEGFLECGSTNDEAKLLAMASAPEGTIVVSARQVGGRGRFGRVWESPEGGAYVSVVLRPSAPPSGLGALTLALAVGAARALASLGVPVSLKWPNDLEVAGEKLGGILVEMAAEADRCEWVVAGCGLNVASAAHEGATCVRLHVPSVRVAAVAAGVLDGMAEAYRSFSDSGFAGPLADDYRRLGSLWGRSVVVRDALGRTVAEGTARTVDDDGALVLASASGPVRVVAGEVTLRAGRAGA